MNEQILLEPQIVFHNWTSKEEVMASRFWQKKRHATFLINGRLWTWSVHAEKFTLYPK